MLSEKRSNPIALLRKLQLPHHRLEAWLLAYRVHERVGSQTLQSGITQPKSCLEPFEGLRRLGLFEGHVFPHTQIRDVNLAALNVSELVGQSRTRTGRDARKTLGVD